MTGPALMTAKIMAYDTSYSTSYDMSIFNEYERTYELCNEHTVCMYSGNIIKINTYSLTEPYLVNNHDSEFLKTLEQMRIEDSVAYEQDSDDEDADDSEMTLSEDEAAARLLTDSDYPYSDSAEAGSDNYGRISDDSEEL